MTPRRNFALFTGLVRDPALFRQRLELVSQWKLLGLIEEIVCSTWVGELNGHPEVRRDLHAAGAHVVETVQPTLRLPGHVLHQMKTLRLGLEFMPQATHVLKLRGDLGRFGVEYAPILEGNRDLEVGAPADWPRPVRERVHVLTGFTMAPFYLNDTVLYGRREDLLGMAHFDVGYEVLYSEMGPEQYFHSRPMLEHFPIFDTYFRLNKGFIFNQPERSSMHRGILLGSDFFLKVLASYWLALSHYFRVGFAEDFPQGREEELRAAAGVPFSRIFEPGNPVAGMDHHAGADAPFCWGEGWLAAALTGGFQRDALYERFLSALEEVRSSAWQRSFSCNPFDPLPEVRALSAELWQRLEYPGGKLGIAAEDAGLVRHVVLGHPPNWQLLGGSDSAQVLQAELARNRRTVDELTDQLGHQNQEILRLRTQLDARGHSAAAGGASAASRI